MSQQGKEDNFNENAEKFECFDSEKVKSSIQNNNEKFQLDKRKYLNKKGKYTNKKNGNISNLRL